MANKKLRHNWNGYYQIRSAPGVRRELERRAMGIARTCNRESRSNGYRMSSRQGAKSPYGRWRTTVITATGKAMRHNAETQALVRHLQDG